MKKGWEIKKLGEVAKVIYGYTEKASLKSIGPKFLRITDIQNGSVNWETVPFCKINKTDKEKYKLIDGDIVFARTGATTGKSFLVHDPPESVFASYLIKVHITNKGLMPEYLFLFFQTKIYWDIINAGLSGSAQGGFNATKLSGLNIPIPPLSEQKRIVSILDKSFTAIAKAKENAEKNLKNARELFESYLQNVFTNPGDDWETEKMVEVCSIITCGVASTPKYVDSSVGIPFLSAQNVKNGEVILDKYRFISREFHEKLTKNNKPTKGDILYSRVGAKYGEAGVVEHDFDFSVYVSLTLIRPIFEKLNNYFLKHYLNSSIIKSLAKKSIQSSGVPNLNVKDVREFPVTYPSLEKQYQIVNQIEVLLKESQKLENIYQQKLADLEELKKSILQKAFNGELN